MSTSKWDFCNVTIKKLHSCCASAQMPTWWLVCGFRNIFCCCMKACWCCCAACGCMLAVCPGWGAACAAVACWAGWTGAVAGEETWMPTPGRKKFCIHLLVKYSNACQFVKTNAELCACISAIVSIFKYQVSKLLISREKDISKQDILWQDDCLDVLSIFVCKQLIDWNNQQYC